MLSQTLMIAPQQVDLSGFDFGQPGLADVVADDVCTVIGRDSAVGSPT